MTATTAAQGEPSRGKIARAVGRSCHVLVVEDDGAIRSLIARLVRREQWTADEAPDGAEALERIRDTPYDAIVLDLMIPRLSGPLLLEELRRSFPSLVARTVIVTASPAQTRHFDTTGTGALLVKPFDIDDLTRALRACTTSVS